MIGSIAWIIMVMVTLALAVYYRDCWRYAVQSDLDTRKTRVRRIIRRVSVDELGHAFRAETLKIWDYDAEFLEFLENVLNNTSANPEDVV